MVISRPSRVRFAPSASSRLRRLYTVWSSAVPTYSLAAHARNETKRNEHRSAQACTRIASAQRHTRTITVVRDVRRVDRRSAVRFDVHVLVHRAYNNAHTICGWARTRFVHKRHTHTHV